MRRDWAKHAFGIGFSIVAVEAASSAQPAPTQSAFDLAKSYLEDTLKDPTSAKYTHIETHRFSVNERPLYNVCGYVYAKNGAGLYDGRSQFVVGLSGGRAIGLLTDMDNNQEAEAVFREHGDDYCSLPLSELTAEVSEKLREEYSADEQASAQMKSCQEETEASKNLDDMKNGMQCLQDVVREHINAYSRIVGTQWRGPVGHF